MYGTEHIEIDELENVIYDTLVTDSELFSKYHVASPCNPFKGLNYIVKVINETYHELKGNMSIVKLTYMGKFTAGYLVYFDNILYSFGVNVHHRNKEAMELFWSMLNAEFGDNDFFCTLHNKNTRAIDFLTKNGGKVTKQDDKHTTICL